MIAPVHCFELKSPPPGLNQQKRRRIDPALVEFETMAQDTQSNYNQKLRMVLDVTKAFRSIIHLDVLLDTIVQTAAETVGTEAGSILLMNEDEKLCFHSAYGTKASEVKPLVVTLGEGIAGWTAKTRRAALVNDVANDSRFDQRFDESTGFTTRSVLCVPLLIEHRVIGVLELINKLDKAPFEEQDLNILFNLADQAAISIEHVRLRDAQNNYSTHVIEILIGAMDTHVPVKVGHARRVARYASLVGRGYPEKLEGAAIPLGARIIGACDAFDIITSKFSYKSPLPYEMALREMEAHSGTQFDPDVVAAIKAQVQETDTVEKTPSSPPTKTN